MQLRLDPNKTYAIALGGGGAKGAYEIGVWKALEEAGIRYNAVSGTSVGALNGALMAMHDYDKAVEAWNGVQLSSIVTVDADEEAELKKLFGRTMQISDLYAVLPRLRALWKRRGLDIAPLRAWIRAIADPQKIRESDVELFVTTLSLTERRGMEIKVNDLESDEAVYDMLLASAYHPAFKNEPLYDGKQYLDGGVFDSLPLHVLIAHGYRSIIGIRLPGGLGFERRFRLPGDASVWMVCPDTDLGGTLDFDADRAHCHMRIGYFDAKRMLYGLYGRTYYIERTLSDRNALDWILDRYERAGADNFREVAERTLPQLSRRLDVLEGDYYELMIAMLEEEAQANGVDPFIIRTDRTFMREIADAAIRRRKDANES